MSGNGLQIQILLADDALAEFLADPDLKASGVRIEGTKPADETATFGFDLLGAMTLINAVATALGDIGKLATPLARLLKKSPRPVVVATAFGTVTLDPARPLTDGEIRKLLRTLATL
jgi:hypothetical protein